MEGFVRGDIVVIHFPYTDLSAAKKRPALIITPLEGDDLIMCQITSKEIRDKYAITLAMSDIVSNCMRIDPGVCNKIDPPTKVTLTCFGDQNRSLCTKWVCITQSKHI